MVELLKLCQCEWLPVQTNAVICLANALYHDDSNRTLMQELPQGVSGRMASMQSICCCLDSSPLETIEGPPTLRTTCQSQR